MSSLVSSMVLHDPWQALRVVAMTILACVVCLSAKPVQAQEGNEQPAGDTAQSDNNGFVPDQYQYTVKEGDNLTLLVRRAIQLFDQARNDLSLSAAKTIYCETNIVQDMGARDLIYPGEKISVNAVEIERYTTSAEDLSAALVAAWQAYADKANLDVATITPTNVTVADDGQVSDPTTEAQPQPSSAQTNTTPADNQDSNTWYWWFIGAGTVAIIWYVLWRREGEPA